MRTLPLVVISVMLGGVVGGLGAGCGDLERSLRDWCARNDGGEGESSCNSSEDCCQSAGLTCAFPAGGGGGTCQRLRTDAGANPGQDAGSGKLPDGGSCGGLDAVCSDASQCCRGICGATAGAQGKCCMQLGGECAQSEDCCGTGDVCRNGFCEGGSGGGGNCKPDTQGCSADGDCCSGQCLAGLCAQPEACAGEASNCESHNDCCGALACVVGRCSRTAITGAALGSSCTEDRSCETGQCSNGASCATASTCNGQNAACADGTDCCGVLRCSNQHCQPPAVVNNLRCYSAEVSCRPGDACCAGVCGENRTCP